jgi:site-specific recombinase XerD
MVAEAWHTKNYSLHKVNLARNTVLGTFFMLLKKEKERVKPLQYLCQFSSESYLIHQRKSLIVNKLLYSSSIVLLTKSRFVCIEFVAIAVYIEFHLLFFVSVNCVR